MVPSELTGEVSMGGLLIFLVCWRRGCYIVPDQQGDKSCQNHLGSLAPTHELGKLDLWKKEVTSAWQTAEWGMCMIQTSFLRLKDHFVYEERGEHRIYLMMLVLIYNMRARMVGINQIQTTYMKYLT
jgi:hypothetical protein